MGRVRRVSNPSRGTPSQWTTTDYDALGRVATITHPDGAQVQTDYTGNQTDVTDEAAKVRRSFTDALGRLTQVVEDPGGLSPSTAYTHDALDNLKQVVQGVQTRTFAYDSLSRLICASNPESRVGTPNCATLPSTGVDRFTYDANSNLLTKTDARGVTLTFGAYDGLNRPTTKDYSDLTPDVAFCYDGRSYGGGACAGSEVTGKKGYLTAVGSSVSSTSFDPDLLGRVTASTQTTGQPYSFSYVYNVDGSLQQQTYPSNRVLSYGYDNAGRVTGANAGALLYASAIAYEPHGAISAMTLGNNRFESAIYNARLQPTTMRLGTGAGTSDLWQIALGYGGANNNGNLLSQTITVPGLASALSQSYTYDGINRLKTAAETGNWSRTYDYDGWGNRAVVGNTGLAMSPLMPTALSAFSSATNRITDGGTDYDPAGNLTLDAIGQQFSYDAENLQMTYFDPTTSSTMTYAYDGEGRRVKKVAPDSTETVFVYDAFGNLAAEYSTAPLTGTGGTFYRTLDHLGSTRVVTDDTAPSSRASTSPPSANRSPAPSATAPAPPATATHPPSAKSSPARSGMGSHRMTFSWRDITQCRWGGS